MEAKLHTGYSTNDRQERNEREISFPGSLSPPDPRDPGSEVGLGRVGKGKKHELKQIKSDSYLVIIRVVAVKHFRNLPRSLFHLDIFPNKQVSFIHATQSYTFKLVKY